MATPSPKGYKQPQRFNLSTSSPQKNTQQQTRDKYLDYSSDFQDLKNDNQNTMADSFCFSDFYEECTNSNTLFKVIVLCI